VDRRDWTALGVAIGVLVLIAGAVLLVRSVTSDDAGSDLVASLTETSPKTEAEADIQPDDREATGDASPEPSLEQEQKAWANEFCTSRQDLAKAVSGLGSNLDWEFSTDASVLEQLDRQIRVQVLGIGAAAGELGMLLTKAPVDPVQVNDWAVGVTEPAQRAQASVDEVTSRLDAMLSADGFLDGVGKAGEVITSGAAALSAGQELISAVQDASDAAQAEFAPAFAAAPACQG
jgi:hypothetical protein